MKTLPSLVLLAILASSCASPHTPPRPSRLSKGASITSGASFGPWGVSTSHCQVNGRTADFTLTTNGRVENDTLLMEIRFATPPAMPPHASIIGLNQTLPVEGDADSYNFTLPYTPQAAAQLLQPDSYLAIRYQPPYSREVYESSLPTQSMVQALAALGTQCP
ncbi:MAG: hypothetical protein GC129_05395 [Proteobacteria bacterium]|nr:hypothetical protein [Pseudomonadota bacterium]